MEPPEAWLILFLLGVGTDLIYTFTIKGISGNRILSAIVGNMLLSLIGFVSMWIVIKDQSLLEALFYVGGCGVGTYISMSAHKLLCQQKKKSKRSKKRKPNSA